MPRNVEIKATVKDIASLRERVKPLATIPETILQQEDTYFQVNNGRLKMRETLGKPTELVHYNRSDSEGPKLSEYSKQTIDSEALSKGLKEMLTQSLGTRGVVKKTRYLSFIGQTRVHVDNVDGLGTFMEFEVMLGNDQSVAEGQGIAEELMTKLGIEKSELLTHSYIDISSK